MALTDVEVEILEGVTTAKLDIEPGDTLVLMSPRRIRKDQKERISDFVVPLLPDGCRVMILDEGITVAVLHPTNQSYQHEDTHKHSVRAAEIAKRVRGE